MAIECDRYGFFNGIYGLEQTNWASYWRGIIPDGVLAQQGNEMQVYVPNTGMGMQVYVDTGQAMVDNHRVWLTTKKTVAIAGHGLLPRIDLVVIRVTYGNSGESLAELDVKTGTEATNPSAPDPIKNTGGTYELPLARIYVSESAETILPSNVTDMRYVYKIGNDSVTTFTDNSVTCVNDIEYRNQDELGSLTINLPGNPNDTYITGVCFTTNGSFSGVTFRKGGNSYTDMRIIGDALTMKNKRYNVVIWWDSGFGQYWCASKGVAR